MCSTIVVKNFASHEFRFIPWWVSARLAVLKFPPGPVIISYQNSVCDYMTTIQPELENLSYNRFSPGWNHSWKYSRMLNCVLIAYDDDKKLEQFFLGVTFHSLLSSKFCIVFCLYKHKKINGSKNFRNIVFRTNTSVCFTLESVAVKWETIRSIFSTKNILPKAEIF